mmetsp:Transcript_28737/g.66298  ORF Transcript_28737/g.66298 Transcript_28737/m.66298 type:complete len:701 (+) Transcript_28737:13-2115(+)
MAQNEELTFSSEEAVQAAQESVLKARFISRILNCGAKKKAPDRSAASAWIGALNYEKPPAFEPDPLPEEKTEDRYKFKKEKDLVFKVTDVLAAPDMAGGPAKLNKNVVFSRTPQKALRVQDVSQYRLHRRKWKDYFDHRGFSSPLGSPFRPQEGPTHFLADHNHLIGCVAKEAYLARLRNDSASEVVELFMSKTYAGSLPCWEHRDFVFSLSKFMHENNTADENGLKMRINLSLISGDYPCVVVNVGNQATHTSYVWGDPSDKFSGSLLITPMDPHWQIGNYYIRAITGESASSFTLAVHIDKQMKRNNEAGERAVRVGLGVYDSISTAVEKSNERRLLTRRKVRTVQDDCPVESHVLKTLFKSSPTPTAIGPGNATPAPGPDQRGPSTGKKFGEKRRPSIQGHHTNRTYHYSAVLAASEGHRRVGGTTPSRKDRRFKPRFSQNMPIVDRAQISTMSPMFANAKAVLEDGLFGKHGCADVKSIVAATGFPSPSKEDRKRLEELRKRGKGTLLNNAKSWHPPSVKPRDLDYTPEPERKEPSVTMTTTTTTATVRSTTAPLTQPHGSSCGIAPIRARTADEVFRNLKFIHHPKALLALSGGGGGGGSIGLVQRMRSNDEVQKAVRRASRAQTASPVAHAYNPPDFSDAPPDRRPKSVETTIGRRVSVRPVPPLGPEKLFRTHRPNLSMFETPIKPPVRKEKH